MSDFLASTGILLVDKPAGPTSHDIVAEARRVTSDRKVGHAGTLDPFATGLLVLGLGRATRLLAYLVGLDKEYEATARFGAGTDSHDLDGKPVATDERWTALVDDDLRRVAGDLTGQLRQTPPVYSAVKVGGVPAHRRSRRGEVVRLPSRTVSVYEIEVVQVELPHMCFRVRCSTGTYIRSLAAEFGRRLGSACHLTALRRTRVGSFRVESAASLGSVRAGSPPASAYLSPAEALSHLPQVAVGIEEARLLATGRRIPAASKDHGQAAFVLPGPQLVAVGAVRNGVMEPRKVFWRG